MMSTRPESFDAPMVQPGLNSSTTPVPGVALALLSKPPVAFTAILVVMGALAVYFASPKLDEREPPPLKSRIPFIGHLIGIITHRANFLTVLSSYRMPIATLPILNGKMYAVWDAALIQAVYRNKDLSFEPFVFEFAQKQLGYDDASDKIIKESGLLGPLFAAIHESMGTHNVNRMNVIALGSVAARYELLGAESDIVIPNLYTWIRDLMTMATTEALYGSENPVRKQPSLIDDLWTFEGNLPMIMLGVVPSITARKGFEARKRLQDALGQYYAREFDTNEDASGIVTARAATLRRFGLTGHQLGNFELALLHAASANTIPTLFWLMAYVLTRPELVERLREEALAMVQHGPGDEVVVDVGVLGDKCPLLVSCYRETIRLNNRAIANRRAMADTTISDGQGRSYLLKEGVNVQLPSGPLHRLESVWGADADAFAAERFLDDFMGAHGGAARAKRASLIPFGGGRHLCPGRNFAFAENLGFMVSLLAGFEAAPVDGDWEAFREPGKEAVAATASVKKPRDGGAGFGLRLRRRRGWEATRWRFVTT